MEKTTRKRKEKESGSVFFAVPMRGFVAFPKMVLNFDAAREKTVKSIEKALEEKSRIFLVAQTDPLVESPSEDDLYKIGVVAEIKQVLRLPENVVKVFVEGVYRAKILSFSDKDDFYTAEVRRLPSYSKSKATPTETEALIRSIKTAFENYMEIVPKAPKELMKSVLMQTDPVKLFEEIVFNCTLSFKDKQTLLEEPHVIKRLMLLNEFLNSEIEIMELESEINEQARSSMDKGQREYFLREQLRAIQEQLGEEDGDDAASYMRSIMAMKIDKKSREKLIKEAERLAKLPSASQEAFVIKNYLDTVLALPWGKYRKPKLSIKKAEEILDNDHYGMKKVKERILEFLAVHIINPDIKGQIICLAGPPGVGKTSIGKSVAKAMDRDYVRVSLGGVRDEADIRGHRKTYVGAMPGRIIAALENAGSANPLILFDEIDKLCNDMRGDPSSAMLEVLDSEQNNAFRDHFLEVPFDLSKAVFITTANNVSAIPAPLLDRMELIELPSYTAEEKFHIAKDHLIPRQLKNHGLKGTQFRIENDAINDVISFYTKEAGVRNLERCIASLCRKAAKKIASEEAKRVLVKADELQDWLGARKYTSDISMKEDETGVVNGLAWTSVGGVIMPLEVIVLDGTGKIEVTGSLGDVMKESSRIAVSYVRSIADRYGIDKEFYKNKDMHIHAPEGAVPKDGPSAGVTMTTAIVSALSGKKVRADVAMTGEITLHGKVLPIGGLREKTMAAYKAGIKTIIIPVDNKPDLDEVDDVVKDAVEFVFAENITDVLDVALTD